MTVLGRFLADETGTATIEFCFVIPIVMTIFMASVEASLYMARHAMLERSVDIVVRGIRLGHYDSLTHNQLKTEICESGMLGKSVQSCVDAMSIWMQPINTANFAMVAPPHFVSTSPSRSIRCSSRPARNLPMAQITRSC
jgi:hypothetical protein